jgi:hypothetical protein
MKTFLKFRGFAIHAYWHDNFGTPCHMDVNMPEQAGIIYNWHTYARGLKSIMSSEDNLGSSTHFW